MDLISEDIARISINDCRIDDCVVVLYDEKNTQGKERTSAIMMQNFMSVFMSVENKFIRPKREDVIWYQIYQVHSAIPQPNERKTFLSFSRTISENFLNENKWQYTGKESRTQLSFTWENFIITGISSNFVKYIYCSIVFCLK